MNEMFERVGLWLADYYLLSTVLLLVVLGIVSLMRQPARKLALIQAALVGLLILAVLCVLPNWSSVRLTKATVSTPSAAELATEESKPVPTTISASPQPGGVSSGAKNVRPGGVDPDTVSDTVRPRPEPMEMAARIGMIFMAGSALCSIWLVFGMWHLRRLCRESERAPAPVMSVLEDVAGAVPLLPRLLLNGRLPSAVACGVWDTSILIPKHVLKLNEEELVSVMAHEWAHVKNGDLRVLATSRLLVPLLWAHPLYWFLRRRLRLEQETLADASAAALTSRQDYATQLLGWARTMPTSPHRSLASAVGIWEGPSQLRRRIAVLLDDKLTILRTCSRRWRWIAGSLVTLMAVVLSLITLHPASVLADGTGDSDLAAREDSVYDKFLGEWEVVSVEGTTGRFMELSDRTKPGDRITIPHVRVPISDGMDGNKVHSKSPFTTRWASADIERRWNQDDSLYLYPESSPGRCTYKARNGQKPHFSEETNPPHFAIYRFKNDLLTLMIGDPTDFEVREGRAVNESSAGTPVKWKWKFVIPNYPTDFDLDPGERQLRVMLKPIASGPFQGEAEHAEATTMDESGANPVIEAVRKEIRAASKRDLSADERTQNYRDWLRRLMAEFERTTQARVRQRLAILALGYANSTGERRTSETLLLELIELAENPREYARWAAELGEVYMKMAQSGLAKAYNLDRARVSFGNVIEKLTSWKGERPPDTYFRLILSRKDRAEALENLHGLTKSLDDLTAAAADYRRGGEELEALRTLAHAKAPIENAPDGHGSTGRSYRTTLAQLEHLGYDADWFAVKELQICGQLKDDARALDLLPGLMDSPGSDVNRDVKVLEYAKTRYGITEYAEFLSLWREKLANEE